MSLIEPPPQYRDKLIIAVFGKKTKFKKTIRNIIMGDDEEKFVPLLNGFVMGENDALKIVNTPDFFDEQNPCSDQMVIDFMALSQPGPHLFLLAIDSENSQQGEVVSQIDKLQTIFGEGVTEYLAIITHTVDIYNSLHYLASQFSNIKVTTANENLARNCQTWCLDHESFHYDYKNYSQDVVMRRKDQLYSRSYNDAIYSCIDLISDSSSEYENVSTDVTIPGPSVSPNIYIVPTETPLVTHNRVSQRMRSEAACGGQDETFSIVLLGQTGTGKSASANTILAAGNADVDPKNLFKSKPSSVPVTTRCQPLVVTKFKTLVRLVDTPDFFYDPTETFEAEIEECKRYCQPGRCVVLLVIQLGRFTNGEEGLLEKLEDKLGWKLRDSTVILLTHGEGFKGSVEKFINERTHLRRMVSACGNRCHVFRNTSRDLKQVTELIKKFPNYRTIFPNIKEKKQPPDCGMC